MARADDAMDLDDTPLARQEERPELLPQIEQAEKTVVELVHRASMVAHELERLDGGLSPESMAASHVQQLLEDYADQCALVRTLLLAPLKSLVQNNPPQNCVSSYGTRQDIANTQLEIALLTEELRSLDKIKS